MTRKKIGSAVGALVTTRQTPHPVVRPMNGTGVPVRVDAVYEVRELHPSGDGPWSVEAEKIAWTDEMSGYACIIRRAPQGGHLCGYVAVPPGHPLFGMNPYAFVGLGIGVHGGISYASECQRWQPEHRSICHVTAAEARMTREQAEARAMREQLVHANAEALRHDDAWWFGFECNQPDDVSPSRIGKHAHRREGPARCLGASRRCRPLNTGTRRCPHRRPEGDRVPWPSPALIVATAGFTAPTQSRFSQPVRRAMRDAGATHAFLSIP